MYRMYPFLNFPIYLLMCLGSWDHYQRHVVRAPDCQAVVPLSQMVPADAPALPP